MRDGMQKLNPRRFFLLGISAVVIFLLGADYLTPARLEIDVNAPRFRLVRRRKFFPDEELQMEWKRSGEWAFPASEVPAVFGQRAPAGFYAWEVETGDRFESLYRGDEEDHPVPYEWLRTNVFSFDVSTQPLHRPRRHLESAEEWARSYHDAPPPKPRNDGR
jgi:hypothetical protein